MELQPNKDKKLLIEIDGRSYARYPVKTKLITPEDKEISEIILQYAKPHVQLGDILFVSEKAVAVTQGRSYHINDIKPTWLATTLSFYVMKTPVGIGLGSPQTMQLALEEVGILRILLAAAIGALGKLVGIRGLFYIVAGNGARSIDGAVSYAIPPYNNYVSKGPVNADNVAQKIANALNIKVAIVDANDLGVNILGASEGVDRKFVARAIKDNPLGQSDEQTPIGIIRQVIQQSFQSPVRKAGSTDLDAVTSVANLLRIDIPYFIWADSDFILRQIIMGEYFVIEKNGQIAGTMSLRQRNNKMHIETLAIKEEFQLQGLGTLFIEFAKDFAKQNGFNSLHAYSFIEYQMADFYLKKGFTKLEHFGYYKKHPYHCFEMKL